MPDETILETELRGLLHGLTVLPDDARADEMSSRAARRRRSLPPVQAAAAVMAVAAATVALGAATHGTVPAGPAGPAGPATSLTPAVDREPAAPSQPGRLVLRLRCVAPGGQVTESTVTTTPGEPRSSDAGNWARVYFPRADGAICTEIPR